jgi:hypothetical protein
MFKEESKFTLRQRNLDNIKMTHRLMGDLIENIKKSEEDKIDFVVMGTESQIGMLFCGI